MKIKTVIITMLLLAWAVPSFAITAKATYEQFARFEALINSPNVTGLALQKALEQVDRATAAYAETSAATTPLGRGDERVGMFRVTLFVLMTATNRACRGSEKELAGARSDVRSIMNDLRQQLR